METIIRWDDEEKIAHIYTASPITQRKLDALCITRPDLWKCIRAEDDAKWYETKNKYIAFRKPQTLSEEQKIRRAENLRKQQDDQED